MLYVARMLLSGVLYRILFFQLQFFTSFNVPAICDHMGRFPDVLSGNPASMIALWCKQPFLAKAVF